MTIEEKVKYSKAKLRNIIYYRLEIEPTIETRYRCQYINVLRSYRKQVLDLVKELDKTDSRRTWFLGILKLINPKIKSNECLSTIIDLKNYVEQTK